MDLLTEHIETVTPYLELLGDLKDLAPKKGKDKDPSLDRHIKDIGEKIDDVTMQARLDSIAALGGIGIRDMTPDDVEPLTVATLIYEFSKAPKHGYLSWAQHWQQELETAVGTMLEDGQNAAAGKIVVAGMNARKRMHITGVPKVNIRHQNKDPLPAPTIRFRSGITMWESWSNTYVSDKSKISSVGIEPITSYRQMPDYLDDIKRTLRKIKDGKLDFGTLCMAEFRDRILGTDSLPQQIIVTSKPSYNSSYVSTFDWAKKTGHEIINGWR